MRKSIRVRANVAFTSLAIGPLLLVGIILAWQGFATQEQQALDLQREVARRVATEVTAFFEGLESELRLASRAQMLPGMGSDKQRNLLTLLMAKDDFEELALLDNSGQEQIHLSRLSIASVDLHSRAQADEFIIPHTSGQVYYSPVRFDEASGEPLMTIAVPLLDVRTGLTNGVLVSEVRLKRIWDMIADVRVSPGQSVYIVDAQGRVVAHRNPSVVLRGTHFDLPKQDSIQKGLDSTRVVLAVEMVRFGKQEFNIVSEQVVSEALALAINTVVITVILVIVALVIASVFSLLAVRQIVRPIQIMAATAQAVSTGDLSRRVEITSQDELGVLADTFNSMTVQLQTLVSSLEQQVAERTAQLEASNKDLEAFAYSVSHDLRAPLRHIAGFVDLLSKHEEGNLDATSSHYLETITQSTEQMGRLIDDLLTLSRAGRTEMQTRRVVLDEMIRKVQGEFESEEKDRHITWEIDPLPDVEADPILLRQVWANLLSNAVKFTAPRAKARIEVGALPIDAESNYVTLFVRDNGVGFDPQYTHKLFGVFQRLHREEDFKGTGIGLATVRRIIERHGGQVWAESEPDHGATFYLTLRKAGKDTSRVIEATSREE
ncbi:MAG: ATP-binding protein [Anaerolineae bacterium]|jgi:signal transduction histidine kinase